MRLRVGVVGLGRAWQTRHRPALRSLNDRFEVRAVCDAVAHRAKQAADDFQASAVDGFRALAARPDIDAVLLLSARWYGSLPIFAACDAGKAIFCAASLDLAADEARRIRQRVDQSGVAFVAEFPYRRQPATTRLKELIATRLGAPRLIFCHQRISVEKLQRETDGARMREMLEAVDWCSFVAGRRPSSVTGVSHRVTPEASGDDYHMMSLDFSTGVRPGAEIVAQISCGRYIPREWPEAITFRPPAGMQVACENGVAFIDPPSTLIWFDHAGRHLESLESERPVGELLLCDFHRAVTSLVRNTASLEDAYQALTVVLAAEQSHAEGRRISLLE